MPTAEQLQEENERLKDLNQGISGNKELQERYYVDSTLGKDCFGEYYRIK